MPSGVELSSEPVEHLLTPPPPDVAPTTAPLEMPTSPLARLDTVEEVLSLKQQ